MNTPLTRHAAPRVRPPAALRRGLLAGLVLALSLGGGLSRAADEGARGHGGPVMGAMHEPSPEHLGRMVDRMLDVAAASEPQRTQIRQIVQAAAADLKPQREAGRALHEQQMKLFVQPTVDPAAVEQLRQQMLAHHDQVSRRMTQALLDISGVLTPEQRVKVAERMKARGGMMGRRHPRQPASGGPDRPAR